MATPTPSTNTPQKHLPSFSSPAPRSVPPMVNFDSPAALGLLTEGSVGMGISMSGLGMGMGLGMTASAMGRADEEERRRRLEAIISTIRKKPGRVSEEGIIRLCKQESLDAVAEGPPHARMLVLLIGSEAMCEVPVRNGEVLVDEVKLELNTDRHSYGQTGSKVLQNSLRPLPGMTKINLTLDRFANNLEQLLRMDKLSATGNGGVSCYQAIFGVYASLRKLFDHEKKMALALSDTNTEHASQRAEREVLCKRSGRPRLNARSCLGLSLEYWMDRRHLIAQNAIHHSTSSKGKDKMEVDSEHAQGGSEDGDPETNTTYSLTIECEASSASMYSPIRISDSWISDAVEKVPGASDADLNNILLNQPTIDWLEPPPTYLPSAAPGGDHDAMNLDSSPGRLPNIRFVAKFNPPLTMPLSVYVSLLQSVGLEVPHADIRATTFVGLVLRPGEPDPGLTGTVGETTQEIKSEKLILIQDKRGGEKHTTHTNSLYVPKIDYSRTIDALPFQHPRQLIEILPILRQYAFTTSLIEHTFGTKSSQNNNNTTHNPKPTRASIPPKQVQTQTQDQTNQSPPIPIDLTLSYSHPAPRLRLDVPHPSTKPSPSLTATNGTTNDGPLSTTSLLDSLLSATTFHSPLGITLEVGANAELIVTEQNVYDSRAEGKPSSDGDKSGGGGGGGDGDVDMGDGAGGAGAGNGNGGIDEKVKRIAKALDVCGDVGVWAEWVRREAADADVDADADASADAETGRE